MMQIKTDQVLNSIWTFIVAVLVLGPLALPLLWRNPRYSRNTKIIWSVLILLFTVFLLWGSAKYVEVLMEQLQP